MAGRDLEAGRRAGDGLVVRTGRKDDLPELVRIYNHYVTHSIITFDTQPVTVESRLQWFERFSDTGPHRLFVATTGYRVLGCASSSPYRTHPAFDQTVELGVYVDPDARAAGIGSALYRTLIETLRSQPVHVALAGIALPNDASVALHRKFGFTDVGTFAEYATKNGGYISSVWMQLRLPPSS
ncbi:GNAT family N-acetyltransferase [Streptomyces phaeochromogenes]|uniref:GNAT family N-acetyltransferase n=1 Tax=Streptomyces phaeochromogenes TaxID=1923 RepID=UPI000A78FDC5|nr:GNAT family N-acetyltransferase [Streptomyces phaeochromogenes]